MKIFKYKIISVFVIVLLNFVSCKMLGQELKINSSGYFEKQGLNVIVFDDIYPEGHQGGVTIIQHGKRVAANGDLYLQTVPEQWSPYSKLLDKKIDKENNQIIATLMDPDSNRMNGKGQPYIYPEFNFIYKIKVISEEKGFRIIVDLDKPLPKEWVGKVGFNIDLFPGNLFSKTYLLSNSSGVFPRYPNTTTVSNYKPNQMADGKALVIAPEDELLKMKITSENWVLQLLDSRVIHNNGWFVVRTLVPANVTKKAINIFIEANTIDNWLYKPVIHTSQVGYHPNQIKKVLIELDKNDNERKPVEIKRFLPSGDIETVVKINELKKSSILRYNYLAADITTLKEEGMYFVQYSNIKSEPFKISKTVYRERVWQPVIDYFLPVQMCHMKVFEKYRVWHDYCHLDDALMAPENIYHFDGYTHGKIPEGYYPLKHVKGLNKGGWHDAGDYDFRIESQLETILALAYAYEEFNVNYDQTLIEQENEIVEVHHPDGKPDILQQIEHGVLTVLGGYKQFGKLYRGIITSTLRQYVMLGDAGSMTDNKIFKGNIENEYHGFWHTNIANKYNRYFSPRESDLSEREYAEDLDDRLVFLDNNVSRQLQGVASFAAASRVLAKYNKDLSKDCLITAKYLWEKYKDEKGKLVDINKIHALTELTLSTDGDEYKNELVTMLPVIVRTIYSSGWIIGRVIKKIDNKEFKKTIGREILKVKDNITKASTENPFGIPYHPHIWGAGWGIQRFGFKHYFLYKGWPDIFTKEPLLNALNFILGLHPGENTSSFVSNVGARSQTVAYGVNRADWSFIPGGVISGTNLVRPDLPELLEWPYLWQQAEYVI